MPEVPQIGVASSTPESDPAACSYGTPCAMMRIYPVASEKTAGES